MVQTQRLTGFFPFPLEAYPIDVSCYAQQYQDLVSKQQHQAPKILERLEFFGPALECGIEQILKVVRRSRGPGVILKLRPKANDCRKFSHQTEMLSVVFTVPISQSQIECLGPVVHELYCR